MVDGADFSAVVRILGVSLVTASTHVVIRVLNFEKNVNISEQHEDISTKYDGDLC